jgi:hypothetical protein
MRAAFFVSVNASSPLIIGSGLVGLAPVRQILLSGQRAGLTVLENESRGGAGVQARAILPQGELVEDFRLVPGTPRHRAIHCGSDKHHLSRADLVRPEALG